MTDFRVLLSYLLHTISGAIFREDQKNSLHDLAFKFAIHKINRNQHILPRTTLIYDIQYVRVDDSFHANKQVCSQFKNGSITIVSSEKALSNHIQSTTRALDIPHIQTHLDADSTDGNKEFSINIFPSQTILNKAMFDVMRFLNWTRCAIIYEQDAGIYDCDKHRHFSGICLGVIRLRDLLSFSPIDILVKTADQKSYHGILQELKDKEIYNMIIDIHDTESMSDFLKAILELQMNDFKYHYLFTSFDLETFEMEDFRYNFVNITAFRLVDTNDVFVKEILKEMEQFSRQHNVKFKRNLAVETQVSLIYDAVFVFAIGLQTLQHSSEILFSNVSCKDEKALHSGSSLINFINTVEFKGISGQIEFKEGQRNAFKLDLIKLKQNFFVKCGEWSHPTGLNITDYDSLFEGNQMNTTLVVVTILQVPYVMIHTGKNTTGNARFYGFCIDVLERISKIIGFNYILDLVHDRKYGAKDPISGDWNGEIFKTVNIKADLAVASMTINYARESVIDFSKPFMNLGISILFKVPESEETKLFSFLNPLAVEIWIFVFFAYCLVSFTVWIVARFSEWSVATKCNTNSGLYENHFTLSNSNENSWKGNNVIEFQSLLSFWFVIGTLMQQGSDLNPKATSTRIVGGIWWFFTLIIISSYTANLAAFLTVERMITPIENAEDLATQTEISYGTLESGSTMTFFRDSMIETYKKMWRTMENKKPSVFVPTYEEGIRRVLEGNYAFLMESTMLDYNVQRDCNLTQIGGNLFSPHFILSIYAFFTFTFLVVIYEPSRCLFCLVPKGLLDTKGYGIATPKGSIWRDKISLAILELQEKGEIQMLYDKWWKNTEETCTRDEKHKDTKANSLGVGNIGGVFVVLLCGLAFAVLVAIVEFCYKTKKDNFNDPLNLINSKNSLCAEMTDELCFALSCKNANHQRQAFKKTICNECRNSNNLFLKSQSNMINDIM
ncbi:CLUMA_CG009343, isoform A [Clunio marinus]|uniref:CLUMA_CG009343, isoform A n=1 Tax=Clunio marinus TaxID=568069 RepID=A0A1J1IBT2_9DIPT|nr:CLUMA_CG009343, isoform A [Clunio marinus]